MPLSWVVPRTDDLFGPGYELTVQSNIIGPIPDTYRWLVSIYSIDGREARLLEHQIDALSGQHVLQIVLADPSLLLQPQQGAPLNVPAGTKVRLIVDLVDGGGQRIDGDTRQVTWDPTGRLFVINEATSGVTGSFTETDRETIQTTEQATLATFPAQLGGFTELPFALGQLVQHLPEWLASADNGFIISGRGELSRPSPFFNVNAMGVQWEFATLLPGLGLRDGAVQRYFERILQLVALGHDAAGIDYVQELRESSISGERWTWGLSPPDRLLYDVLPGCSVRVRWLLI